MYMMKDCEEVAYFFKVENGTPNLFARWGIGVMEPFNALETSKQFNGNGPIISQMKRHYENLHYSQLDELAPIPEILIPYLEKVEQGEYFDMGGTVENPEVG